MSSFLCSFFFFFNDTATTEIYTLSLHDALPIYGLDGGSRAIALDLPIFKRGEASLDALACHVARFMDALEMRSEEHTSELQSPDHLVCRLLLEKKKKITTHAKSSPTSS